MIVLGIDVGIESMGFCVIDVKVSEPTGRRKIPFVSAAKVVEAGIISVAPFQFTGGTRCAGKTKKGRDCGRRVSHARLLGGEITCTCPGHAKSFGCKIMSGAKLRPGAIFDQLRVKFGEIADRFPDVSLVVIESQPKMSNMFPIQYSVEISAHTAFPGAATVFYPSKHKLKQLGIVAPRGKRKHGQRKGLADKAIRDAVKAGSIDISGISVLIPEGSVPECKKYDDIADSLVIAVASAKNVAPALVRAGPIIAGDSGAGFGAYDLSSLL